jgi:hypothetical protein
MVGGAHPTRRFATAHTAPKAHMAHVAGAVREPPLPPQGRGGGHCPPLGFGHFFNIGQTRPDRGRDHNRCRGRDRNRNRSRSRFRPRHRHRWEPGADRSPTTWWWTSPTNTIIQSAQGHSVCVAIGNSNGGRCPPYATVRDRPHRPQGPHGARCRGGSRTAPPPQAPGWWALPPPGVWTFFQYRTNASRSR